MRKLVSIAPAAFSQIATPPPFPRDDVTARDAKRPHTALIHLVSLVMQFLMDRR